VVQMIGSVEDEWCFSTFTYMKTKLNHWLTKHLELVIWMISQKSFTMQNFPFGVVIQNWKESITRYGVEAWMWMWILQLSFVSMSHVILDMMVFEVSIKFQPFWALRKHELTLFLHQRFRASHYFFGVG
jgi:hypothetical protein